MKIFGQIKKNKKPYVVTAVYAAVLAVSSILVKTGIIKNYVAGILITAGIYIILAVSLNVATGYLGQLPLGHAGFMAVGAYASGILLKALPTEHPAAFFPLTLLFGGIVAALFGLVIGIPALRLRGDYLAIITLGFGEIIRILIINIDSVIGRELTCGSKNLDNIPKTTTFFGTFLAVGLVCLAIYNMMHSRHGRAILAVRDNEIAAESCGISLTFYKTFGFTVSAFFAGIAGGLYASYFGLLNPEKFGFMQSIEILVMVVLGGVGSMFGSAVAAAILTILPQVLIFLDDYRMLVYSLLLILVMIYNYAPVFAPIRERFSFAVLTNKIRKKPTGEEAGS